MKKKLALVTSIFALAVLFSGWQPASVRRSAAAAYRRAALERPTVTRMVLLSSTPAAVTQPVATTQPAVWDHLAVAPVVTTTPIPSHRPGLHVATATATWDWSPAGEAKVPILLYHHVAEAQPPARFFVSPQHFKQQMQKLSNWGYQAIPLSLLVQALKTGARLPPRPVVITFDDGYRDVYDNAFPIMKRFGFTGVDYLIIDQLEIKGYLHLEQVEALVEAGWEIGSHTRSHSDLRKAGVNLEDEISGSRRDLEELIGAPVITFSFPYGLTTRYVTKFVQESGYESAVGLGGLFKHTAKTRYYLSRIEIQGDFDLQDFASLLPWSAPLEPRQAFDGTAPSIEHRFFNELQ